MPLIPTRLDGVLDGYQTTFNQQQHINFFSGANHVCELYYDGAKWHANDLTSITGAPAPSWPYALNGYATEFNQQQHVNFVGMVGNDAHIIELYYDGSWHWNDLTQLAGAPPDWGSKIDGYETSFNQQQHVNFLGKVGSDVHLFELYYDGTWRWNDLTQLAGAPPCNALGGYLCGYQTSFNQQQHVIFVGNDFHVNELYYDGNWHWNDLTKLTGAPPAGQFSQAEGETWISNLDGYVTSFNQQQHINYIGIVGNGIHVHELDYDGKWHWSDLTRLTGAPPPSYPYALDGYATEFQQIIGKPGLSQHVNFIGVAGNVFHVFELYYDGFNWNYDDLSQLAGVPNTVQLVAKQFALDGYETSFNRQQHVNFIGIVGVPGPNNTDVHVYELYYDGSKWQPYNDLTVLAV